MRDPYEIHLLDVNKVRFTRGSGGVFQGVIEGKEYQELVVYRTFPFKYTTTYISIRDTDKKEIGIIRDTAELDEVSRKEIVQELQFRYFLPQVTQINSVKQRTDLWIWELQTNLGPTRITMRNLHDYMQYPGENRIILTDVNGKRCEIPNWKALNAHSIKQLKDVI